MELRQRLRGILTAGAAPAALLLAAYLVYRPVLAASYDLYPWGSDTLGHIFRYEYLGQAIAAGDYFPEIFPDWYLGVQLIRYYPPLAYYLLLVLASVTGNAVQAVNLFIFLATGLGAASWLLYRRWLGPWVALAGGMLFLLTPDNVRVAFAEGNLPRVLANALVPILLYLVLTSQEPGAQRGRLLGLALVMAVVVMSHPMMAAIYAVVFTMLLAGVWASRRTTLRKAALSLSAMSLGILLPGWWLFPSLTGGITELNSSAVARGLDVVAWSNHLNPFIRATNPETVYVGLTLLAIPMAGLLARRARSPQGAVLATVGFAGVLITTPGFNEVFTALPLSSLLWPVRFLGVVSVLLLLASLLALVRWKGLKPWGLAVALLVIGLDFSGSRHLIHLRSLRPEVLAIAEDMAAQSGWRQATLDHSRLGSAPSYFFTSLSGREQVFGWAYQGARTATNVASLNEAMNMGANAYLLDRLSLLGVDDVVLVTNTPAAAQTALALDSGGYERAYQEGSLLYYHRDGSPRAVAADWSAIGIGRGALNYAYLFPEILIGDRPNLDDYNADELQGYDKVILSGFAWRDRATAEELVYNLAHAGVQVFIDLTGTRPDPLARIPHFLDVWGEPIILASEPIQVLSQGTNLTLGPFGEPGGLWHTLTPQGLDEKVVTFDHLGETATIAGYREVGNQPVWFLGINLVYEALLNDDPGARELLADLLNLPPGSPRAYRTIPLDEYQADHHGYRFAYRLEEPTPLLIPVAHHDGTALTVDGAPVISRSLENLVVFQAPAGEHTVEIRFEPTRIYTLGRIVSTLAALALAALLIWGSQAMANSDMTPPMSTPLPPSEGILT